MSEASFEMLRETRAHRPDAIAEAAARRSRRRVLDSHGRLMLVAADHGARGALAVRGEALAMADRYALLDRLMVALSRPGVDGVLGSPDILEDLLLLGALEDKVVVGSMNRGGLFGASWEIDDRFTAYDADSIAAAGFEAGKMLLRLDDSDPATARTLEACAHAVSALAALGLLAMVEPFVARSIDGRVRNDLSTDAVIRSVTVSSALGTTSAWTWLKLPVVPDMDRVMAATTLPTLLLGGDPDESLDETYGSWEKALAMPGVRGLVVGRTLLYPPDGDVAAAVDAAAALVRPAGVGAVTGSGSR